MKILSGIHESLHTDSLQKPEIHYSAIKSCWVASHVNWEQKSNVSETLSPPSENVTGDCRCWRHRGSLNSWSLGLDWCNWSPKRVLSHQSRQKLPSHTFITVCTISVLWSLLWTLWIQYKPSYIFLPSVPWSFKCSFPFRFSNHNSICYSHIFSTYYMPCMFHPLCFDQSNIRWWIQIMKLLIMQFSSACVTFFLIGSNTHLSPLFSNPTKYCSYLN
jgi:hypothetical protein